MYRVCVIASANLSCWCSEKYDRVCKSINILKPSAIEGKEERGRQMLQSVYSVHRIHSLHTWYTDDTLSIPCTYTHKSSEYRLQHRNYINSKPRTFHPMCPSVYQLQQFDYYPSMHFYLTARIHMTSATRCNSLQHTQGIATHWNTLQHIHTHIDMFSE